MSLFQCTNPSSRARLPVSSVQVLVKPWHYCHMYGRAHEIPRTESCAYKKSEPQKRTRYQAVNGDFRSIQKAPQGGAPLRSQTFLNAQLCSESLNPALCARSLKAARQALACSTSPGWHRGRPGSHRQGARNHHAELPTPAAAAPTRPAT
jgi:hypothetical protein